LRKPSFSMASSISTTTDARQCSWEGCCMASRADVDELRSVTFVEHRNANPGRLTDSETALGLHARTDWLDSPSEHQITFEITGSIMEQELTSVRGSN
jgi:hypothetical protein